MAHSSGGGSSGGGFHSGGGSSFSGGSHSGGGFYHHYYGRGNIMGSPFSLIFVLIWALGFGGMPFFSFILPTLIPPTKLVTSYDTKIMIEDNINVLSKSEEAELKSSMKDFLSKTGITPAIVTVDKYGDDGYLSHNSTLESYALEKYNTIFKDESHWLICYSESDGEWAFEGIQGDNTDSILSVDVTDRFNKSVMEDLDSEKTITQSLKVQLPKTSKEAMGIHYFDLVKNGFAFILLFPIIAIFVVVGVIVSMIKGKTKSKD